MKPVAFRERIYTLFTDPGPDVEGRIQRALEVGTAFLDLSIGFFTRIEDDTQEIVLVAGDHPAIEPGQTCPLDEAYCRRIVESASPLAFGP